MNFEQFSELDLKFEERWENLTIANDFIFGKVFQDLSLCLELVQSILPELNIINISFPELQKSTKETFDTRGVRFDIYVRDDKDRIIDVEMQIANRDNIRRRTRAYHSIIDLDAMNTSKVKKYDDMPDVIVIFICNFDLFKLGRYKYTFKNVCIEEHKLQLNDGASTIFLNTLGEYGDISENLRAFLRLLRGETSSNSFVERIEQRLFESKQNYKWRQEYMLSKFELNDIYEEALDRGRAEGIAQGRVEGIAQGRVEGIAQGRVEGIAQGRVESTLRAISFMRENGLSQEQIEKFKNAQGILENF